MAIGYFDKDGKEISSQEWKLLSKDDSYSIVKAYDNGVVNVYLKWIGRVPDANSSLPEYRKLFVLLVKNYKPDGTLVNDPVDNDKYFPTLPDAIDAYEKFLMNWTACGLNDDLEFQESDNTIAPPKPPDPNRPEGGEFEIEGMTSAW